MKGPICLVVLCLLPMVFGMGVSVSYAQTSQELTQFDDDAAQCRREVRQYCAIVQDMMKEKKLDASKQEKGLALLKDARKQWAAFSTKWGANPPPEYRSDKTFTSRLKDIASALEDMEEALEDGEARRSFTACSFGCGLFVTMHEQNGLPYALDALFHLRKAVKTAGAISQSRGLDGLHPLLSEVMQKRDRVLTAPAPWQKGDDRLAPYYETVRQLSRELDEWVLAVEANESEAFQAAHKKLLEQINTAYGLAL